MSIYEVHLGSWGRHVSEGRRFPRYVDLADPLADHVLAHDLAIVEPGDGGVTLFVSDVPFYRTLTVGTVGDDVRVLEESLVTFGFDAGGALIADGEFDDATQDAVFA